MTSRAISGIPTEYPAGQRANKAVVFLGGAWFSGSTLLGVLLGAHPAIFYAGEAQKTRFFDDPDAILKKRVCRLCGPDCTVWGDLHVEPEEDLYEVLSRRTGRPIVFDSTKGNTWIKRQVEALRDVVPLRLIVLTRDGRAVVNSRLRKKTQYSAHHHTNAWVTQMRDIEELATHWPGAVHRVRYEELTSQPEPTLRGLADFIGVPFDPAMLDPWNSDQHPLGSNAGPLLMLLRERAGNPIPGVINPDATTLERYDTHPREMVLDLRWKRELSADNLAAFEEVAGEVNRAYAWEEEPAGYRPVGQRVNTGVVFMGAACFSGSTLLGVMLGAHPVIFYAGEAANVRHFGDPDAVLKKRVCRLCGPGCTVWGDLQVEPEEDLYEVLSRRTGRPIVFDSSKGNAWIRSQVEALRDVVPLRLIVLTRDGRAVVNSRLRKKTQHSAHEHAARWARQMRDIEELAAHWPGAVHRVRYEELTSQPEPTLRGLADFIGVPFDPAMLDPWDSDQHPLGSNAGPLLMLLRERACGPVPGVINPDVKTRERYDTHPREMVLDLRWERELSADDLAAFEEVAGEANRAYAWEEPHT